MSMWRFFAPTTQANMAILQTALALMSRVNITIRVKLHHLQSDANILDENFLMRRIHRSLSANWGLRKQTIQLQTIEVSDPMKNGSHVTTGSQVSIRRRTQKSMNWMSPSDLDIGRTWNSLPPEIQDLILAHVDLTELFKAARVSKSFRDVLFRDNFKQLRALLRPIECTLGPLLFCVEKNLWHLWGFDWKDHSWRKLPPFTDPIPAPDPELFKDFLVAGHHGLICANMGKASESEKLYIFNPLTGEAQQLPPLNYPRHPVVIFLQVTTPGRPGFRVIAVGSAAVGKGYLSRKTEVYCSIKRRWEVAGDVPGEEFSLNEYQTGVYCETQKLLLCTGFMVDRSKGILAFDVGTSEWRAHWNCPFFRLRRPHTALTIHFAIAQLVECNGVIYLFSEQETGGTVTHCIDRLDLGIEGTYTWARRLTLSRRGTRALLVYPEFTCVPVEEHKLCIFNTVQRTGDVYDMSEAVNTFHYQCLPTPPPLGDNSLLYSLNPFSYSFQPSFGAVLPDLKPDEDVKKA